jgi:SOS-response transcriptional repressor LexA
MRMAKRRDLTPEERVITDNLRQLWDSKRRSLGLTQEIAAEEIGISPGAVNQYLVGRIPLNARITMKFANVLRADVSEIDPALGAEMAESVRGLLLKAIRSGEFSDQGLGDKGVELLTNRLNVSATKRGEYSLQSLPLLNWEAPEDGMRLESQGENGGRELVTFASKHGFSAASFAVRVAGKSAEPEFSEGDAALVDPAVEPFPDTPLRRCFVFAKLPTGSNAIRRYFLDGGLPFLEPINSKWPDPPVPVDDRVQILGVIKGKSKDY